MRSSMRLRPPPLVIGNGTGNDQRYLRSLAAVSVRHAMLTTVERKLIAMLLWDRTGDGRPCSMCFDLLPSCSAPVHAPALSCRYAMAAT